MKNKKLLLMIMCVSLLTACKDGKPLTEQTTSDVSEAMTETAVSAIDALPTKDFDGYEFKILVYDNVADEHAADTLTGDSINDAVYERNEYVKNRYNIDISVTPMAHETYIATVANIVQSNEDPYDLYQIFLSYAATNFAPAGYFLDWNDIAYVNDNLDEVWWCQYGVENLQLKGENYFLNGGLSHYMLFNATGLVFNKDVFTQNGLEYPYESVYNGTWTLDSLLTLCAEGSVDLNGDSKYSIDDDYFAFLTNRWAAPAGLPIASDLQTLKYESNGYPILNVITDRTVSMYEKMYQLIVEGNAPLNDGAKFLKTFSENRAMFIADTIYNPGLRDVDCDFGYLPYPKYEESQKTYITSVDGGTASAAVLITASDTERTGLITEVLCQKGYELVFPAAYNDMLQGKLAQDEDSRKMLEIMYETSTFDPLYIFNFNNMGFFFNDCISSQKKDIVSDYQAKEKGTLAAIESFWEQIENSQ